MAIYGLQDTKVCRACGKAQPLALYLFVNYPGRVAVTCQPCRNELIKQGEEGVTLLPIVCATCGERKSPEQFIFYRPGSWEAGKPPETSIHCRACLGPSMDVERTKERKKKRREAAAARRAAKAVRPRGRPVVLGVVELVHAIERACRKSNVTGVPMPEIVRELAAGDPSGVCPVTTETIRRRLHEGLNAGQFRREPLDHARPWLPMWKWSTVPAKPGAGRRAAPRFRATGEGLIQMLTLAVRPATDAEVVRCLSLGMDPGSVWLHELGDVVQQAGPAVCYIMPVEGMHEGGWILSERLEKFGGAPRLLPVPVGLDAAEQAAEVPPAAPAEGAGEPAPEVPPETA